MFHLRLSLRQALLALAIVPLLVFGTNLPGTTPFTIPSALAATPVPTMPPGTKAILTEPSPDPIPYVAAPGNTISSSQENTNKWTITNYLNNTLVPFFNSCSFFPWNAINTVSTGTSPITASVSACAAGGQTLTLGLNTIPAGLLPTDLAKTDAANTFTSSQAVQGTLTFGETGGAVLHTSTGYTYLVPASSTKPWAVTNAANTQNNWVLTDAGNATLAGTLTTGGAITIPSTASVMFGSATGNGQLGTPGSGTTIAGIGCSLMGVAAENTAWKVCIDSSGNMGATNFFSSSRRSLKTDIVPLGAVMPDPLGILSHTDWAQFQYKATPGVWKIGFIADDTPAALSGPKHDHMDAEALGTVDAMAILQLKNRMDGLEAMVRRLCALPANRKEKVCVGF